MKKTLPPGWILATLALSLGCLWAVLSFLVIAKPWSGSSESASAQVAQQNKVKTEVSQKSGDYVSHSLKDNGPSEPEVDWGPVALLDAYELAAEIEELEARVEREDAIRRLNVDEVSDADRKEYGKVFARIVELKSSGLKEEIDDLTAKAQTFESSHVRRLTAAGLSAKTPLRSP